MRRTRRFAAAAVAVFTAVVFLLAAFLPVAELYHDCAGEACPICAQIAALRSILRGFAVALILLCAVSLCRRLFSLRRAFSGSRRRTSPILLKTKLLN